MWWITILIDIILVIIAFVFCNFYYNRHYSGVWGEISLDQLRTHEVINGKIFGVTPSFSNFSTNVLLKCIVTIICIVIVHFTDSLFTTYVYIPYLLLNYWMFNSRLRYYKAQPPQFKSFIKPALVASFILPLFQTVFLLSLYLTYFLNS